MEKTPYDDLFLRVVEFLMHRDFCAFFGQSCLRFVRMKAGSFTPKLSHERRAYQYTVVSDICTAWRYP